MDGVFGRRNVRWAGLDSAQEFDPARFAVEAARRALASAG
jgi:hypothetical protein